MHKLLLGLSVVFFAFFTRAQQAYEVSGKVLDANSGQSVPYASVALYSVSDSSMVDGMATDEQGKFSIKAVNGSYYLKIDFLSYDDFTEEVVIDGQNVDLGAITLTEDSQQLDAVEVKTERSRMELKLDKRVFNVEQDLTNQGGTASEILENVPSVNIDVEGNVTLRGSNSVRIFINGRPSGLTGISTSEALQQLPADMIEKVEVITNPSARYEAEGEVGIINIVLKKNKKGGLNGSFQVTAGWPHLYGVSTQLNYKTQKYNLFGSYSFRYNKSPGFGREYQTYDGPDTTYQFENTRDHFRGGFNNNVRLGADFFLNEYNTLTVSGLYSRGDGMNGVNRTYQDYDEEGDLIQTIKRTEDELEPENNIQANINYRKTFDQKDRVWTINTQWFLNDEDELADINQYNQQTGEETIQRTSNTEDESNFLFQTDYVHPFGKNDNMKFELGAKTTYRRISNEFKVEQYGTNDAWNVVGEFDNHFIYNEFIQGAYAIFGGQWNWFSLQTGVRGEYTDVTTELVATGEKNRQQYPNFFPSAHLSFEIDSTNTIQLSYSRRITRPRFRHLLPFYSYSDPRDFYQGNPNLQPEFTDSYELGYLTYFKIGSLMSSVYYRHKTDVVERITVVDSTTGLSSSYPVNLATQDAFGLELNLNFNFFDWWQLSGSGNFYRAITSGEYQGQVLESDTYTFQMNWQTNFKFWKIVKTQVSFNYRAPRITTQGRRSAVYFFNAGVGVQLFKGKGNLSFNVRDMFNTRVFQSVTESEYFYKDSDFQWRSRQFTLNFTYRLNGGQKDRGERGGGEFDDGGM